MRLGTVLAGIGEYQRVAGGKLRRQFVVERQVGLVVIAQRPRVRGIVLIARASRQRGVQEAVHQVLRARRQVQPVVAHQVHVVVGLIPRRRQVLDALGALVIRPKRLPRGILDGVIGRQRVQVIHIAQLRSGNRRLMIDAVLRQLAEVVIEGAVLLHHEDDVVQVGNATGAHRHRRRLLYLIVERVGRRRRVGRGLRRMHDVGPHLHRLHHGRCPDRC